MKEYLSINTIMDNGQSSTSYHVEFLNSIEVSGVPSLGQNILGVTILTGEGEGDIIPRIPIIPTDLPFQYFKY